MDYAKMQQQLIFYETRLQQALDASKESVRTGRKDQARRFAADIAWYRKEIEKLKGSLGLFGYTWD